MYSFAFQTFSKEDSASRLVLAINQKLDSRSQVTLIQNQSLFNLVGAFFLL